MKRSSLVPLFLATAAAALVGLSACSAPAAPAPTAAPTKAAAPAATTAPAAPAATAAPAAAKSSFPEKGKTITIVVPASAGGPNDIAARVIAPLLEKDLGTPVQVVNKPGAGWQLGLTEIAKAKPDGYTIGYGLLPITISVYLDPERKAAFGRKDLQLLAQEVHHPGLIAVQADSPFKTIQDVIAAAKANPGKISANTTGILGDDHLAILQLQKLTDTKFAIVHFDGASVAMTQVLGGHVDVYFGNTGDTLAQFKSGAVRVLGLMDKEESKYYPGVKTVASQGTPLYSSSDFGIVMAAGAPKEVVDTLSAALKKAIESDEHVKKMDDMGYPVRYGGPAEFNATWEETEKWVAPLIQEEKKGS